MEYEFEPIEELTTDATLPDCIAKINELIRQMNHMWHPEHE
jgi:hypothetical protein